MEVRAETRYTRLSPSKARDLAAAIRGKTVAVALGIVSFSERKAAQAIRKTLKSAIANAQNNAELSADDLFVKDAVIDLGPTSGRFWARARGMASPIKRRTSHVRIVLTDKRDAAAG